MRKMWPHILQRPRTCVHKFLSTVDHRKFVPRRLKKADLALSVSRYRDCPIRLNVEGGIVCGRPRQDFLHLPFAKSFPYRDDKAVCRVNVSGARAGRLAGGTIRKLIDLATLPRCASEKDANRNQQQQPRAPAADPTDSICSGITRFTFPSLCNQIPNCAQYLASGCWGARKESHESVSVSDSVAVGPR